MLIRKTKISTKNDNKFGPEIFFLFIFVNQNHYFHKIDRKTHILGPWLLHQPTLATSSSNGTSGARMVKKQ